MLLLIITLELDFLVGQNREMLFHYLTMNLFFKANCLLFHIPL